MTQPNQGASSARNLAFSTCQGEYVQWLDADDLLAPDKIEKQMAVFESGVSDRTLLSSSWGHFNSNTARAKFIPTDLWYDLSPVEWLLRKIEQDLYMQPATWLVSRTLTDSAGPWDTRLSLDDDGEYSCRLVRESNGVKFVPDAKVFYRRGFNTLSDIDYSPRKLESQRLALQLQIEHLLALENTDRTRRAGIKFLQTYAILFYPERVDLISEFEKLAKELGGRLETPQLSWKYAWIQKLFGWTAAKRAQRAYNRLKSAILRTAEDGSHASPRQFARQHGS